MLSIASMFILGGRQVKTGKTITQATALAQDLPEAVAQRLPHLCKRIYRTLQLSGCARLDFRLDAEGRLYVLEANPNPQLARGEDFADAAAAAGIEYGALLQRILQLGLQWEPNRVD